MAETHLDILSTLKNEAFVNTICGTTAFIISGGCFINDTFKKDKTHSSCCRLPLALGMLFGAQNIITGTLGFLKYNQLMEDEKKTRYQLSFFICTKFTWIQDNGIVLINSIKEYLNTICGLKIIDLTLEEVAVSGTGASTDIDTNIKVDVTFIITNKTLPATMITKILSGQIKITNDTNSVPFGISPVPSSKPNYPYPYISPYPAIWT